MTILSVKDAAQKLSNGGIVIFPTDTAFGIGCDATSPDAVERLFRIRQRPTNKPTPVLVSSIEMAMEYLADVPQSVLELMDEYWPGALTIIARAEVEKMPSHVRGGTETLGVRMPNNDTAREIIRTLNKPILGPSANFHGQPTPYTFDSVDRDLIEQVAGVVQGECRLKRESTVLDTTVSPWRIVRQGAVDVQRE